MEKIDFDFVKAIHKCNDIKLYKNYLKYYKKQQKLIPDKIAVFITNKSILLKNMDVHMQILDYLSNNILRYIYPGLFTYYFRNYNVITENCILKLIKLLNVLPTELRNKLFKFYKNTEPFNTEVYTVLIERLDDEHKLVFCTRLLDKCGILDIRYVKNELEVLLDKLIRTPVNQVFCFNDVDNKPCVKSSIKNNFNIILTDTEKRIVQYTCNNITLVLQKHQYLPFIKFCHLQDINLQNQQLKHILADSFDLIKILSADMGFIEYYLTAVDDTIELLQQSEIDKIKLCMMYFAKYNKDIINTKFYKSWLTNTQLNETIDNCYIFLSNNLRSFNDENNYSLLEIFYNLIQFNTSAHIEKILDNVFECIYSHTDAKRTIMYLHCIKRIVEIKILPRKYLKYIFKQLVYYDNEDYRTRCFIYKILERIISDYSNMDKKIDRLYYEKYNLNIVPHSNALVTDRIENYDIENYHRNNAKVLAALVWFDLKHIHAEYELPYKFKLILTIIQNTETFYEKRVMKSEFLLQLISKHRELLDKSTTYNSIAFFQLIDCLKASFKVPNDALKILENADAMKTQVGKSINP